MMNVWDSLKSYHTLTASASYAAISTAIAAASSSSLGANTAMPRGGTSFTVVNNTGAIAYIAKQLSGTTHSATSTMAPIADGQWVTFTMPVEQFEALIVNTSAAGLQIWVSGIA